MTEETKQKLREVGREDLIEIHEINQAGYAGIMPNGGIVDRRKHPDAMPVPANRMMNLPIPRCIYCGSESKTLYKSHCPSCQPKK